MSDPYEPDMVQIFRFDAQDDRPERWSWEVTFAAPQHDLNQEGFEPSLAKALLCVSCAIEAARDTQRLCIAEEKARARILDDAHKLGRAGFGLPARELP